MPEQLSQAQIDELLNRLNKGGPIAETEDGDRAKEYDFKSPKKFTKEQLKALDGLHENFSRMMSSYLSSLLRTYCEMEVVQIEEQTYYEYNNALPDSALLGIIDFFPKEKDYNESFLIMDVSTAIGFLMVERLLGGSGKGYSPNRDYTDIEIAIINTVFIKMTELLQESWGNYIDTDMSLRSIETNSRMMQALAPEDTVVIVMVDMKIGELKGNLNICIPGECLEEIIDSFSVRYMRASKKQQDPEKESAKKELILEELTESDLEITAILDNFQMRLRDITQLQVSDVVLLNKDIKSDIIVTVDNEPWFTAKLGESRLKKLVKLNNSIA